MNMEMAIHMGQNTLYTVLILTAPVLLTALLVGSIVSLFQAVTQIQEQTLALIPKIIAMVGALLVFGSWMLTHLVNYVQRVFDQLPNVAG